MYLRDRYPTVSVPERRTIEAAARELSDLAWQPDDLHLPRPAKSPIPSLI